VQGGSAPRYPKGWNLATGYGMPPDFFTPRSTAQFDASATQPMTSQSNASATQPMTPQQSASAAQPTAHNTWSPQMAAQVNASASPPMTPQKHLTLLLQPKSPSEILISKSPHQGGVNWIFHDQMTGILRYVNVPYMDCIRVSSQLAHRLHSR
jgi:hypothetical protein